MKIRPTDKGDLPHLIRVLNETGLFPSEMLPDMIDGFLAGDSDGLWLTALKDDMAVGLCFAEPEHLADGTWNMRAIAVLPELQGSGCGAAIVTYLEAHLRQAGHRILIVDTSGSDDFAGARAFYDRTGYTQEARIRAFWGPGDDKIMFWKDLNA